MQTEVVKPNISNFIKSLRDVGYTFEIAVADVLDNSISANASEIRIFSVAQPENIFCMLDNGDGMSEPELLEAMRLATKSPDDKREKNDLGRFGLGLKTASFSQCKTLTVLSKRDGKVSLKQWDLDYLEKQNEWCLITPDIQDFKNIPLVQSLKDMKHGTLVIWQKIDRYKQENFTEEIDKLRKHLSLVFHRFLERRFNKFSISINKNPLKAFNPFNVDHSATYEKTPEKIKLFDTEVIVTPYILPHHQKLSQQEWEEYSTEDGYIKSQGFYLYRANRLLVHGTWWGLHKATDAHKLVRIKIDVSNDHDKYWGIDIKKSTASPMPEIKKDLKRIIKEVTKEGSKPFSGRGKRIKDKTTTRFWEIVPNNEMLHFALNRDHPVYQKLLYSLSKEDKETLEIYLRGIEAYLPLDSIQSYLQQSPHQIKQKEALPPEEVNALIQKLKTQGLSEEYIENLLKAEMFENQREALTNE